MHIVTLKHLKEAIEKHPDAANEIRAWKAVVEAVRWHNIAEVRSIFKDADPVDGYVVFNIRHNRYRLITVIHYAKMTSEMQTQGHVYIRSFLTHKEYDNRSNWDKRYREEMSTVIANPAEMIAHGAPHVIHNDTELEAYTEALFQLTALENPSRSEVEAIELLTLLVERYEQERYPIAETDPVSVLRLLLERQNLAQRALIPEFGSESAVSMFLSRQRTLTLEQVRKLSARFKLPADVFMPKASAPHRPKAPAKRHSRSR